MEIESMYSAVALREAGASSEFIDYYEQAHLMGIQTNATRHVDTPAHSLESVAACPANGGSFFKALWNGEPRYPNGPYPYGEDMQNAEILKAANVL